MDEVWDQNVEDDPEPYNDDHPSGMGLFDRPPEDESVESLNTDSLPSQVTHNGVVSNRAPDSRGIRTKDLQEIRRVSEVVEE